MGAADMGKTLVATLISLVVFIIMAIIVFLLTLFIIKVAGEAVFAGQTLDIGFACVAAAVLTSGSLIGGGAIHVMTD